MPHIAPQIFSRRGYGFCIHLIRYKCTPSPRSQNAAHLHDFEVALLKGGPATVSVMTSNRRASQLHVHGAIFRWDSPTRRCSWQLNLSVFSSTAKESSVWLFVNVDKGHLCEYKYQYWMWSCYIVIEFGTRLVKFCVADKSGRWRHQRRLENRSRILHTPTYTHTFTNSSLTLNIPLLLGNYHSHSKQLVDSNPQNSS